MPHFKARPDDHLLIHSMGKKLRILAIFTNDTEANAYMSAHDEAAVIACFGPFIFLANRHDTKGE